MPAPARTGRDEIVAVATRLLEAGGVDGVTMQAVAEGVGVRAPSLYKHVRDRRDLLAAVVADGVGELTARLAAAQEPTDARASLVAQLDALRRFAHERPRSYALVMGASPDLPRSTPELLEASLRFLLAATTELAGEAHALDAARLVVAWSNGFISMELAGALQLGGDLDAAWAWGLQRIVAAAGSGRDASDAARSDRT